MQQASSTTKLESWGSSLTASFKLLMSVASSGLGALLRPQAIVYQELLWTGRATVGVAPWNAAAVWAVAKRRRSVRGATVQNCDWYCCRVDSVHQCTILTDEMRNTRGVWANQTWETCRETRALQPTAVSDLSSNLRMTLTRIMTVRASRAASPLRQRAVICVHVIIAGRAHQSRQRQSAASGIAVVSSWIAAAVSRSKVPELCCNIKDKTTTGLQ